jgi:hypothetical protein
MSLSVCLNYSAALFLQLFIAIMEENQQDHRIDAELLSTFAEHMNFTSILSPTSHSSKAAYMTRLCSNIALSIQMLDDGYLTRQTPPSRTSSTSDSSGLTTISASSTVWPEIVEGLSVGVPTPLIGEPSWELSSFPTDRIFNKKLHGGPASSYVGSTPSAEYAYRPDLARVGPTELDAILDTFASYDHGGELMHNDSF